MHSMDSIVAVAIEKMKSAEIAAGYRAHALAKDENHAILCDMLKVALSHITEAFQSLLNAKGDEDDAFRDECWLGMLVRVAV